MDGLEPAARATVQDALLQSSRIVIVGEPGSGKTALLRRLALMFAADELAPDYVRRLTFTHQDEMMDTLLPIFVSLPRLAETGAEILPYVSDRFADHGVPQAVPFLQRKLASGQCIFLLDGLDQVPDQARQEEVIAQVLALTRRYGKPNQVIVTSRMIDCTAELDGFERFQLMPLGDHAIEDFLHRWFAEDPTRAEGLLAALEASSTVRSMAGNPHLLSVLAVACERQAESCVRIAELLDASVGILLGDKDRSDLRNCAQRLAFELQTRRRDSLSLEDMAVVLRDVQSDGGGESVPPREGLLTELAKGTHLLFPASQGSYRFCRPALRQYLAAREFLSREDPMMLAGRAGDPWWRDVIVLVAGLQRDATGLIHDLLSRGNGNGDTLLLAARCLREADRTEELVRRRVWSRLFELFEEGPPSLWSPAAVAIAALEGKRARDAFPDLLRHGDPELRAKAARAMGRVGEAWAAPPLIAALDDESAQVRREAASALGPLGDQRAIFPLVKLLGDEHADVYREAIRTLGVIGKPTLEPLIGALGDRSERVSARAARALSLLGEAAVPALVTAVGSERRELREAAAVALAEIGPTAIEPLTDALESNSARLRRGAVAALGRIGVQDAMRGIVDALGDSNEAVRLEATKWLAQIGSPAVPLVVGALISPNLTVSEQAANVLAQMGAPAVDGLLQALVDERRALRWAAVKVLGMIGSDSPTAVSKLRTVLKDRRAEVRQSAVRALGRIGNAPAIEVLVEVVAGEDEAVRDEAADALADLGSDEVVRRLREAFEQGADPDRVIALLGRVGSRAARDFLRELLAHDDRAIRNMAAIALESDETSGAYIYRAWEPNVEEDLLRRGSVTTAMLTGVPDGLRTVVLQRYLNSHPETDLAYDAEMGMLRLNTFSRVQQVMEYWRGAGQNLSDEVELSEQVFGSHVASLTRELCSILEVTTPDTLRRERLHCFALDVHSIVKGTNLPSTIPLIFLRREALSEDDLDDLRAALAGMNVYHRTALLVMFTQGERVSEARQMLDERLRDVHAYDVILLGKRDIQHIATAKDAREALRFTICEQADLTLVSPYSFDEPASRMLFFGREFEIRTIIQAIPNSSVAVLGGRRIGKTSILHRVRDSLCESYPCHYLDCHPIRDYDVLFRTLAYRWPNLGKLPPEPVSFHSVVADLGGEGPLILVLDEIDALLQFDIENDELLFKTFRSLSQEGQCRFIFSGERVLSNQLRYGATSPLFNFCGQRIRLGYLEPKSAEKLIVEPMGWMNIDLRDEESVVQGILDLSSCHPRLIQYICHSLIKQINQEGMRVVTDQHMQRMAASNELREEYLWTVWGDATPFEKALTLALEETSVTQDQIQAALERWEIRYAWDDLRNALHNLEICSILERDDGTFRFVPHHFPRIARESLDVGMEIKALKRRFRGERDL